MNVVEALVRDIASKSERGPRLELVFSSSAVVALAANHGDGLTVHIGADSYCATVGLVEGNPPYLRGTLDGPAGKTRWTDVLLPLGIRSGDPLHFEVIAPRQQLRLMLDRLDAREVARDRVPRATALPHPPAPPAGGLADLTPQLVAEWSERYWELCTAREREAELSIERRMPEARRRGVLDAYLFLELGLWKSSRQRKNLTSNTAEQIARASRAAFTLPPREAIKALKSLRGVAVRMAVAMLHWMRPAEFPMLDFRVIESMGWPEPRDWEDLGFYERFSQDVVGHAQRLDVDLRRLDRALWAMSKVRSRGGRVILGPRKD